MLLALGVSPLECQDSMPKRVLLVFGICAYSTHRSLERVLRPKHWANVTCEVVQKVTLKDILLAGQRG